MTSIIYVGMDVHTTNYTLCCYSMEDDRFFAEVQVEPDAKNILKYLARIEKQQSRDCRIVCGYEAGCLGYSLYHQLHAHGIDCVILAPTTMMTKPGKRIKTDRRDARLISKCLAFHTYSPVYIPTEVDDAVKEYIRMRDDANSALARVKQQIIAFCIRHGKIHDGKSYWTNWNSHHPNISPVIGGYKQPSKSAQSIEITGFIEKSKPPKIIFFYTLLPLTA